MTGLNNIREAYEQVYAQMNEALDPEERALRRELARDKKGSKMAPSVAAKYAGSEAQSAARADKKSKGKHIHGMADSYEVEGDIVDETSHLETNMEKRKNDNEGAIEDMKKTKAYADMVRAARKKFDEETISEGPLDPTEKAQKEKIVKALKTKAGEFKQRYGKRWKNVMYATATANAQRNMDTSKSDRRYSVEK